MYQLHHIKVGFFEDNHFHYTFLQVEVFFKSHKKLFSKVKTKREISSNFVAFLKCMNIITIAKLGYFYQNVYYCPEDWPKEDKNIYLSVHI